MKEKDLRPGTVFPVLGTLLFFLPQRYKEKLCCVTPLASQVNYRSLPPCTCVLPVFILMHCQPLQPRAIDTKPYQTGQRDGVFSSEEESDSQDKETKTLPPSCQILPPCDQETSL